MKTTQPPIASDQELAGYRAGAERLRGMIERHESEVMVARQRQPADLRLLDQIRYQLLHLYGYYRGIQEAIEDYVHRQQSASSRTPDVPRRASCPPVLRHFSATMSYAGTLVPR